MTFIRFEYGLSSGCNADIFAFGSAFKIQTHKMFLDPVLNAPATIMFTVYQNFLETAMKCFRYIKCMPTAKQPTAALLKGTTPAPPTGLGEGVRFEVYCAHHTSSQEEIPGYMKRRTDRARGTAAGIIRDVVDLAYTLVTRKQHSAGKSEARCVVRKRQVRW